MAARRQKVVELTNGPGSLRASVLEEPVALFLFVQDARFVQLPIGSVMHSWVGVRDACASRQTLACFNRGSRKSSLELVTRWSDEGSLMAPTSLLRIPVLRESTISVLAWVASSSLLATSVQSASAPAGDVTPIHTIQTAGENPLEGKFVVEAIVTAAFPGLGGFFLQEEDADADNDPATSEGIFV